MKRRALLGHLQQHGCVPIREGGSHSIWSNPQTGRKEAIPRHTEIKKVWYVPSVAICPCQFRPAINSAIDDKENEPRQNRSGDDHASVVPTPHCNLRYTRSFGV